MNVFDQYTSSYSLFNSTNLSWIIIGSIVVTIIFIVVISIIKYKFYIYIIKKIVKEAIKEVEEEKNKDTITK